MDAPPSDSTIVAELRDKGAIIYAKANLSEYNAGSGNPGGDRQGHGARLRRRRAQFVGRHLLQSLRHHPRNRRVELRFRGVGAGQPGACSICEETGGSCRQPAWRNGVVALVTTKGLMPYGGAIGADPYLDRAGVTCRTVRDAALVLDAMKHPKRGYFDPRDIYSALPKALVSKAPYASFARRQAGATGKPLAGLRVGIVREYMVKHSANDEAMSDLVDDEIKNGAARSARRRARRIGRSAVSRTTRRFRT